MEKVFSYSCLSLQASCWHWQKSFTDQIRTREKLTLIVPANPRRLMRKVTLDLTDPAIQQTNEQALNI